MLLFSFLAYGELLAVVEILLGFCLQFRLSESISMFFSSQSASSEIRFFSLGVPFLLHPFSVQASVQLGDRCFSGLAAPALRSPWELFAGRRFLLFWVLAVGRQLLDGFCSLLGPFSRKGEVSF